MKSASTRRIGGGVLVSVLLIVVLGFSTAPMSKFNVGAGDSCFPEGTLITTPTQYGTANSKGETDVSFEASWPHQPSDVVVEAVVRKAGVIVNDNVPIGGTPSHYGWLETQTFTFFGYTWVHYYIVIWCYDTHTGKILAKEKEYGVGSVGPKGYILPTGTTLGTITVLGGGPSWSAGTIGGKILPGAVEDPNLIVDCP